MRFEFFHDGQFLRVHTEVGQGLTKVVVKELNPPAPEALEPSEDA